MACFRVCLTMISYTQTIDCHREVQFDSWLAPNSGTFSHRNRASGPFYNVVFAPVPSNNVSRIYVMTTPGAMISTCHTKCIDVHTWFSVCSSSLFPCTNCEVTEPIPSVKLKLSKCYSLFAYMAAIRSAYLTAVLIYNDLCGNIKGCIISDKGFVNSIVTLKGYQ